MKLNAAKLHVLYKPRSDCVGNCRLQRCRMRMKSIKNIDNKNCR
uniref:Uncharacterized protein n=1 Tax=Arundo donax TaxID=35708 RepID=A0A0A9EA38_ARUDO